MKQLLRSCFVGSGDNKDRVYENFTSLRDSGLGFEYVEDTTLWAFILDFASRFHHVPDVATLQTHYTQAKENSVLERIMELNSLTVLTRGDFMSHLEVKAEERRYRQVGDLLREAATVLQTGIEVKDDKGKTLGKLKGPIDALRFVFDRSHDIVTPVGSSRLSGDITADGEDFAKEYERIEADPLHGVGQHSGIQQMDVALNGAKKFELWIHAAFTGGLKSTLALNWAYNQAVYYHKDVLFFSLEMPYQQCRRILYAIHSYHPKFKEIRYQMGIQSDPDMNMGLPYEFIRDGKLAQWNPRAKEFLLKVVVPDMNRITTVNTTDDQGTDWGTDHGRIFIEIADPDKPDFTVADLRMRADLLYSKTRFKMIFVDHAGLMAPRKWVSSTTDRLNEVLRDLKKLAMSFNRGEGMAVLALFQIGREGFKSALKSKEKGGKARFELVHLSYANEAERSGDVVTTTWVDDDLRKANRVQVQCLKSRDAAPFETFTARIEWPCRVIRTCFDVEMSADEKAKVGEAIEQLADSLG